VGGQSSVVGRPAYLSHCSCAQPQPNLCVCFLPFHITSPSFLSLGQPILPPHAEASEKACSWAVANLYRLGDTLHLLRIIPTLPYRCGGWDGLRWGRKGLGCLRVGYATPNLLRIVPVLLV